MANPILEIQRHFQMWEFTVSHDSLLLRSTKGPTHPTRFEVLFKGVALINLPTSFDGLTISVASNQETSALAPQLGALLRHKQHLFLIDGGTFSGHVIAGLVAWHEDQGEYHQPSLLMSGSFSAETRWPVR